MTNFPTALFKQGEYKKFEMEAKVKYDRKIICNSKNNNKPLFAHLRSKNKFIKTVNNLKTKFGHATKTSVEITK